MKKINLTDYNKKLGLLIDIRHPLDYINNHHEDSINIHYQKLLYNHQKYLNKNEKYYIVCSKGTISKKVVSQLEYFGYDVTQVNM